MNKYNMVEMIVIEFSQSILRKTISLSFRDGIVELITKVCQFTLSLLYVCTKKVGYVTLGTVSLQLQTHFSVEQKNVAVVEILYP